MFGWTESKPFRRKEPEVEKNPLAGIAEKSREKADEILAEQADAGKEGAMAGAQGGCCDCSQWPVSKVMSAKVAVVYPDDTLLTLREVFSKVKFHHMVVVDGSRRVLGVVSDRDVLRTVSPFFGTVNEQTRDTTLMRRPVHQVMTREPICATPEMRMEDAIRFMWGKRISCLPVVDGEFRVIGILTWKDIVRAFCPQGFQPPPPEAKERDTGIRQRAWSEAPRQPAADAAGGGKSDADAGKSPETKAD